MKHSPLPWRYDRGVHIRTESGMAIIEPYDKRFIVLACNHFEEMRRTLCFVADAALVPVNISLMAQELLDKLEADE